MKRLRISLGVLLAACLLLTGHSAAANRVARDLSGQVILCTGAGPVTVFLDQNGEPTGAPHICPDCMMHLLDLVAVQQMVAARPLARSMHYGHAAQGGVDLSAWCHMRARAPPQLS